VTFYNTTNETNPELATYQGQAKTQDQKIMIWFHSRVFNSGFTPSEIMHNVLPEAPITSVRRSMSNLTADGKLVKTLEKRKGIYGRPEYVWKLPS